MLGLMLSGWMGEVAWGAETRAERPLTYHEALVAAIANNGGLATSRIAADRAEGGVTSALGRFDPLYQLSVATDRSRAQGFFQGFPFERTAQGWQVRNTVSGTAGTGTSYSLSAGLSRTQSVTTNDLGGLGSDRQENDFYFADINASVTQQLLEGIRFRYNVQNVTLARLSLDVSELTVAKQRQDTLFAAAEAYWSWVYQTNLHEIAIEASAAAEEALRVGRLQVERGQLAPVEATRLEAAQVQASQDALDASNAAEIAANLVLIAMGEDPGQPIAPATSAGDVPEIALDPASAAEVALAQNLDLALSRQQLEMAEVVLDNARHALLPSLAATLEGGVGSQRCPSDARNCVGGNAMDAISGILSEENQPYLTVSALLSLPIGNRAARGARDQSGADVALRERQLADVERAVAAAVEEQVRALQSARQRTELADANVRLAAQTLSAEEALATAGRTIQRNVLEARTEVSRTRAEAAKARTDYRLAQARLLALQGQLSEE